MNRIPVLLAAGLFTVALAFPAAAAPRSSHDSPACGPKDEKKDEKKNPSSAEPRCGGPGPKGDSKDGKKNPSAL
jgi:hypothetical protein